MLKMFLTFDEFLFPKLVIFIYWAGLVLIGLFALIGAFGALAMGGHMGLGGGIVGFFGALIGGVISLAVWRISMELIIVLFSIHDVLKSIRDQGR